jgi:hypothetical protein
MKTILGLAMAVIGISTGFCGEKKPDDLETIREQLKPLRQKAYKEPDVKAARERLDAAYREYWQLVQAAMLRIDPAKAALIEQDIKSREKSPAIAKAAK